MARGSVIAIVWFGFLADLIVGAGLLLSRDPTLRSIGLAMVLAACAVMVGATLYYYLQQRRAQAP